MKHPSVLMVISITLGIGLVLISHFLLDNTIKQKHSEALKNLRAAVLTSVSYDTLGKPVLNDVVLLPHTIVHQLTPVLKQSSIRAWLIHVTAKNGYSGDIEFFMVQEDNTSFPALRILRHKETPGITNFLNDNRVTLIYDGVSGATITSTGINQSVNDVIVWINQCIEPYNNKFIC